MAMELENIVANTVYIKAREGDRGRSKKWKEMLRLPPVAHCLHLRDELEHSYEYLIEQQPIGGDLFRMFCSRERHLASCLAFLRALDELAIVAEEKAAGMAQKIFADFVSRQCVEKVEPITEEQCRQVDERLASPATPTKDAFRESRQAVREFLSGQPFVDYIESPYYWRYLQWKYLERVPVGKNTFRVYRVLGKGGFGLVHACQSKPTGKMYALKKLEKKRVKKRKGEKLALNEKQILEKVSSRFVVSLAYAYQSKDALCMVLTLMNGGDLRFHIHHIGNAGLDDERVVFYSAEIACGLSHLHACRIAYRDMKPDNILLDDKGHVRISDLGLAVHIPEGQSVRGRVGTVGYMAPEVIDNHRYSFQPDWWGLGCLVYEMVHGECPFRRRKERVSRDEVERRVREDAPPFCSKFSEEAKLFCSQLLEKTHSARLGCSDRGFEAVKAHPFFRNINWTHLETGIMEPPFKPNPRAVYAKDVLDIDPFSSVKGVDIEGSDQEFAEKFSTGAVSKPWQDEMIDTSVYKDINDMYSIEDMSADPGAVMSPVEKHKGGWFRKLFKSRRSTSMPESSTSAKSKSTNS